MHQIWVWKGGWWEWGRWSQKGRAGTSASERGCIWSISRISISKLRVSVCERKREREALWGVKWWGWDGEGMVPDSLVVDDQIVVRWSNDAGAQRTPAFQLNRYFSFSWVTAALLKCRKDKKKHAFISICARLLNWNTCCGVIFYC